MWATSEGESPHLWGSQCVLGEQFHKLTSGRIIPAVLGERQRFPGIGSRLTSWSLWVALGPVMLVDEC